jgi:hypothetical protein
MGSQPCFPWLLRRDGIVRRDDDPLDSVLNAELISDPKGQAKWFALGGQHATHHYVYRCR